jgi:hypothetical protein
LLAFLLRQGQNVRWKQILPWIGAGVLLLLVTSALVTWKFDPSRIPRLISAITDPSHFSSDGRQMPGQPRTWLSLEGWLPFLGFAVAVVPSLIITWRKRLKLKAADFAVVAGCSLTVLMMTGPWFSPDKSIRFYFIALLPAIIVGAFSLLHIEMKELRRAVLGLVLLIGLGSSVWILLPGGKPILEDTTMVELKNLAGHIQDPDHTLVVTDHGVEWWSAWFLHTHIAQPQVLSPDDWQHYKTILFLEVKSGVVNLLGRGVHRPNIAQGMPSNDSWALPLIPADAKLLHDCATLRLTKIDYASQIFSEHILGP